MCSHSWGYWAARRLHLVVGIAIASAAGSAAEPKPPQRAIRVSGELIAPAIERPIDEVLGVDEVILGVRAIGDAHVQAQPQLILADDPEHAAFSVLLTGTIASRTVGRKGPVEIYSRSHTSFSAAKRVCFLPGRGFIQEADRIEALGASETEQIVPDRRGLLGRMIERAAWQRVSDSRDQVDQIVRAKA